MGSEQIRQNTNASPRGKSFLRALQGEKQATPPIWLMRQAGRYLPEYRALRQRIGSFLNLCYSPKDACEVTLQPIRRFGFDAAILFSDILVVPDALGQEVRFETGEGPRLDPITDANGLSRLDRKATSAKFNSIFESVERIAAELPDETALIGFCGAPWTVATYMIGGRGSPDQAASRSLAYRDPETVQTLIDLITDVSIDYLSGQIRAGAEAVQIFDSWAGTLPDSEFRRWGLKPVAKIVDALRRDHPTIPIIGFPRCVGPLYKDYIEEVDVSAVSCDTALSLDWIAENLQPKVTVQGNLDPILLLNGGPALEKRVREIKNRLSGGAHIFNLGHGILPPTPIEHVQTLIDTLHRD